MSFGELANSRMVETVTAFDIWTWRTLAVVISDADIGGYDRWLLAYANIMIECASTPQWMGPLEISEVRRHITERVEARKADARERAAVIKLRAKSEVGGWG